MPAAGKAPPPPPGFVRESAAPAQPSRPQMTRTGSAEEFGENLMGVAQGAGEFAKDQAGVTATHYQNLAHYGPFGMPSVADVAGKAGVTIPEPSPPAQERYRDEVISGALTAAGGMIGRAFGSKLSDAFKYLGRGFRTQPAAQQFIASNPVRAAAAQGQGVGVRELIGPTLSGAAVAATVDALDPGPHELVDDTIATGTGVTTAAAVGKNTIDDLLLANPRWREVMMRPSSGTATGVLGAMLGYAAAKGILSSADQISEMADYVSGLFSSEDEPQPQEARKP